jgi:hypothetical protein
VIMTRVRVRRGSGNDTYVAWILHNFPVCCLQFDLAYSGLDGRSGGYSSSNMPALTLLSKVTNSHCMLDQRRCAGRPSIMSPTTWQH